MKPEEKIFRNRPIRNKNCLWRPCLLMNRDEMSNIYRGPSKDAPYQVSSKECSFCPDPSTDMAAAWPNEPKFGRKHLWQVLYKDCSFRPDPLTSMAARSGQNEHSLERTFHKCFLPSFTSFGREVSEEKIIM
jgi:hypothetical protein